MFIEDATLSRNPVALNLLKKGHGKENVAFFVS